jgi:hypothetical protein
MMTRHKRIGSPIPSDDNGIRFDTEAGGHVRRGESIGEKSD